MDPDVEDPGQKYLFSGVVASMWIGYALEASRLGKAKAA